MTFLSFLSLWRTTAKAAPYPEPEPPHVSIKEMVLHDTSVPMSTYTAQTEWLFHKSLEGLHPDGNEQQMMWLMNRARGNPEQEGVWLASPQDALIASAIAYFSVDTDLLQQEFAAYTSKPPAAFDVRLYNAARSHSEFLIARDSQNHNGQFQRIQDAGFSYTSARGNVFAYAKNALYAHAAFNIDWGPGDGGMQSGRGHRMAIMSIDGDYTNVGLACLVDNDSGTSVGLW